VGDKRFDRLARLRGRSSRRQAFFAVLPGIAASGIAAIAGATDLGMANESQGEIWLEVSWE
jgi:hypothetical protein